MDFTMPIGAVWVMLHALVVFNFFFGVKYFSAFSTHVLPSPSAGGALALYDLTQFFHFFT
jgi:hypothetical protein